MQILIKDKDTLLYDEFEFKCCVGKRGITQNKTEGDMKTPKGTYKLGPVYYRKDRLSKFKTNLKKIIINNKMGWCDDVKSKFYNQRIIINKKIKCEKMFRKNNDYDLLIPIQYNTFKPRRNKGSAIFLHLTNNYRGTLGCVALKKKDMLILLKLINKKTKIKII